MAHMRLGDLLVSSSVITNEQMEKALGMQKETKERLGDVHGADEKGRGLHTQTRHSARCTRSRVWR